MIVLHNDTWEGLTLNMVGLYHDHCTHWWSGPVSKVPDKHKHLIDHDEGYVLIYEEQAWEE